MSNPCVNMKQFTPSRRPPRVGDIFAYQMPDRLFRFGRIVRTDALMGGMPDCLLLYLYRTPSPSMDDRPELRTTDLLLPPIATNRLGWSRGYFKTIERAEMKPGDYLDAHVFMVLGTDPPIYCDEYGNDVPPPKEKCGTWALSSYAGIDKRVSRVLGFDEPGE